MNKIIKNKLFIFLLAVIIITIGFFNFHINKASAMAPYLTPGDDIVVDIINTSDPAPDPVNCIKNTLPDGGVICYTVTIDISPTHFEYNWGLGGSLPPVTFTATIQIISKPASVAFIQYFASNLTYGDYGPIYGYNADCGLSFPQIYDNGKWVVACLSSSNFLSNGGGQSATAVGTRTITILHAGTQSFDMTMSPTFRFSTGGGNEGSYTPWELIRVPGFVINVKNYNYSVSPTSLTFNATQNESLPTSQAITVQNTSFGDLNISVSDNASWLTVTPISLSLNAGDPTAVNASINTTNLSPGTYNATIFFNDPNVVNNKTVNVSYVVSGNASAPVLKAIWNETNSTTINKTVSPGGSIPLDFTFSNIGNPGSVITVTNCTSSVTPGSGITATTPVCPNVELKVPIP